MRVGLIPENPIEWILEKFGFLPRAMFETFHGAAQSRSVMIAAKLGVFECVAAGSRSLGQIAATTGTDARALEKLLSVLVACGYLKFRRGRWELRPHVRRWLLRSSRRSIADNVSHGFLQWEAIENFEQFIRTGKPMELHDHLTAATWPVYVRAMKSAARLAVAEVVVRTRLPRNPKRMLDIGGSHGLYSLEFCRRHPTLEAVILDLPAAVEHAAPLLAEEAMGSRVIHRRGNALTDSLGEGEWDFIFISQLLHHFTAEMNQSLCERIQRALKPGGRFAIAEIERSPSPGTGGQIATIFDLYFAATSRSGTWSAGEMQRWQEMAGMTTDDPIRLWSVPGIVILSASRPAD